jgi:hypothetical protein
VENVTGSDIIAGWDRDAPLERNGVESMSEPPASQRIAEGIPEYGAKPMREPLASGATRTGRGTVPTIGARPLMDGNRRRDCLHDDCLYRVDRIASRFRGQCR